MPSFRYVRRFSLFAAFIAVFAVSASAQSPTDAVTPGALRSYSTIYSIGIEWDVTNDTDHDAAATVDFKVQGAATWRSALPLVRVDYNGVNRLAGSILFLTPDTAYDVRVSLTDPDGGAATQTVLVRTRRIPVAPAGRVLQVVPGSGSGDGSFATPFRGIAAAQAAAQPGDTLVLHAGNYGGPVVFDKPGTSAAYIAWKAAGDGEVLMNGVTVAASHLWFEGITIRNVQGRFEALVSANSPANVVIMRCNFLGNRDAIVLTVGAGSNWYIANNTIVGTTPAGTTGSAGFIGEGIDLGVTSGHTVAYNSITNVADAVAQPRINVDLFGNDIFDTADDGIEADSGEANVRIWGNRIHNAVHNGISFQPQNGGPWYIVRNQIVSNEEAAFKFRTTDRFVLLHNTIVNWGTAWPGTSMMCCNEGHLLRAYARNNLWISVQGGQIWGFDSDLRDWRTDLDYDGFDWGTSNEAFAYAGVTHPNLASFSTASGLETHGVQVAHSTCFEDFRVSGPSPQPVQPHLMTLQAGCPAVDAGAVLQSINDGYVGAAPDIGAYERGSTAAVAYGPRPRGTVVPAAPTFLRATAATGSIGIQWTDNSNNEDGFRIERSTDGTTFSGLVSVGPDAIAYNDTTAAAGVQYYYRVAAYNMAGLSTYSNVVSATIAGAAATEIVIWAAKAPTIVGQQWQVVNDATAAGGRRLQNPNAGAPRVDTPLAAPGSYFELTFTAQAGRAYRLWMRGKAIGDSWLNDSVWAQFDRSVNAQGTAVYRIGSTSATRLALQPVDGATLSGWGWEDNGFNGTGASIYFSQTGTQRLRIQVREDGLGIDQIVLSSVTYFNAAPGAARNDNTILPESGGTSPPTGQEIVVWAAKAPTIVGQQWQVVNDTTAAGGRRLQSPNAGAPRVDPPLAAPGSYFELTFTAQAGRAYRLWMRGKAIGDSWLNDSVWAQFDRSVNAQGTAVYRIGSTSATRLALQPVDGAALSAWGWEDNGFNGTGPSIYFSQTGTQRLRIQVREDGLGIDQIVLSSVTYFNAAPGAAKNDNTILPEQ